MVSDLLSISQKNYLSIRMKYLPLLQLTLERVPLSEVFSKRIHKFLNTFAKFVTKLNSALVSVKNLKLKYNFKEVKDAELLSKFYCLVFNPTQNLDF